METSSVVFNPSVEYVNQDYSTQDVNLLNEYEIVRNFGADQDVIEYYVKIIILNKHLNHQVYMIQYI